MRLEGSRGIDRLDRGKRGVLVEEQSEEQQEDGQVIRECEIIELLMKAEAEAGAE